jgi:CBS domain-containing protein
MVLSSYSTKDVIWVTPDRPIDEAIALMEQYEVHHLPVVRDGRLVGMLSDRDILLAVGWKLNCERRVQKRGTLTGPLRIDEIMNYPVMTLPMDSSLHDVATLMVTEKIGAVPLLESEQFVALITESDILKHLIDPADSMSSTQNFSRVRVRQFMTRNVITVSPKTSWIDALELFHRRSIRHLPVVVHGGVLGIISDRDCLRIMGESLIRDAQAEMCGHAYEGPEHVFDIMTRRVETIDAGASLVEAIVRLLETRGHSLVVTENNQLAGIITETDIVQAIGDHDVAMQRKEDDNARDPSPT